MNAYQLFALTINDQEHKECLQLLLQSKLGNIQFAQLLYTLIQYYSKDKEGILDLSKVLIKKDINNTIQICNIYQNKKKKIPKKQVKVIKFMNYLFRNYYKFQGIIEEEKNWNKFEKWMAIFQKIWFNKKTIHKVIYKIGQNDYSKLLLLPNQNIIYSISNSQNTLILKNSSHIYFNGNEYLDHKYWYDQQSKETDGQVTLNNNANKKQFWDKFHGFIDPVYLIPRGQGKLNNQEKNKQFSCQCFFYTIPNGQEFKYSKSIAFSDEFNIYTDFAQSLFDGGWLNQILVDYIIDKYYKQYQLINQKETKYQIILLDTRKAQDIFSSQITKNNQINFEYAEQIFNNIKYEMNKSMRLIILINVDRCHFICVCVEDDTIYILNSMNSNKNDGIVGQQFMKMYSFIKDKLTQIKNQSYINQQQQIKLQIQQVPQQSNGYDCSIYTLYNSMQLIKHSDIKITNINFDISPSQISELRYQFFQDLFNNNAFLSNQIRWYLNSR